MPESNHTDITVTNGGIYNNNPNAREVHNHYYPACQRIRPAIITAIINRLSDPELNKEKMTDEEVDTKLFEIKDKITINSLDRWKKIIKDCAPNFATMLSIYREFDTMANSKNDAVQGWLNRRYLELKDEYRGDELFDKIRGLVYEIVDKDPTCSSNITIEELDSNVCNVLVDAFMKCSIFEKPTK